MRQTYQLHAEYKSVSKHAAGQLRALTGLRAVAALWVVLVHVDLAHPTEAPYWAELLLGSFGTLPVVFFFMLSGFILAVVYGPRFESEISSKESLKKFAKGRFARIMPVYLASILPALFVLWWRLAGAEPNVQWLQNRLPDVGGHALDHGVLDYLLRANIPAWSLIAEVIFYALAPFLIQRFLKVKTFSLWVGLGASLGTYFFLQTALAIGFANVPGWWGQFLHGVSHFGPPVYIPVFLVGVLMGLIYHRGGVPAWIERKSTWVYQWLGMVILLSALFRSPALPASLISAVIAPVFCLAIFAGTTEKGSFNRALCGPLMQGLGAASYSIYITHWPVRDMLTPVLAATPLREAPFLMGWVLVSLLVAVGWLAYMGIERPMQRWIMARRGSAETVAVRPEPVLVEPSGGRVEQE